MQVFNKTGFAFGITMGMDVAGREYLSLVVKGTFGFPDHPDQLPLPMPQQVPLVMADEYNGEPGYSATTWETDFAFRKGKCDIVLNGAAYAPGGKPAQKVQVGLKVGAMAKTFNVIGHREWRVIGPAITATDPVPFSRAPFSYDTAFGGACTLDPEDKLPPVYLPNPIGLGFASVKNQSRLSGAPLPNTEEIGVPVTSPYEDYRPMALGPISRVSPERQRFAGTYDDDWKDNVFPFLPKDFDERYYQQTATDQQIDYPVGGTQVVLVNLTPRGKEAFYLPDTKLPLTIWRDWEKALDQTALPDAVLIDAENRVFSLTWRVEVPIRRVITEFTEFWIGTPTRAQVHAKRKGKSYRPIASLSLPEEIEL